MCSDHDHDHEAFTHQSMPLKVGNVLQFRLHNRAVNTSKAPVCDIGGLDQCTRIIMIDTQACVEVGAVFLLLGHASVTLTGSELVLKHSHVESAIAEEILEGLWRGARGWALDLLRAAPLRVDCLLGNISGRHLSVKATTTTRRANSKPLLDT